MKIRDLKIKFNKLFVLLYIIVVIIVLVIVWKPKNILKIAKYEVLDIGKVDKLASQKYINNLVLNISKKNISNLYSKLSDDYVVYNNIDKDKFKEIFFNTLFSNQISVNSVKKILYRDNTIYKTQLKTLNGVKNINIIEEYGNSWRFTLEDFYSYKQTQFSTTYKDIYIAIDTVYQAIDYIEFTCYIQNKGNSNIDLNLEGIDSILLQLNTNEKITLANAEISQVVSQVLPNTMSSKVFKFDIDLTNQANIEKIIFNKFDIDGSIKIISIDIKV